MSEDELQKLAFSMPEKQHEKTVHEHKPERYVPCTFALEKFLKEYKKTRSLRTRRRKKPD
ncbi:TPA: hypothetical protein KGE53_003910 [Escherichia coli]|nr:hypothetical protein [Escherichia coli]